MSKVDVDTRLHFDELFEHWKLSPALPFPQAEYRRILRNDPCVVLDLFMWHYFTSVIMPSVSTHQSIKDKLESLMEDYLRHLRDVSDASLYMCINSFSNNVKCCSASGLPYLLGHLCGVMLGHYPLLDILWQALSGFFYRKETIGNLRWRVLKIALLVRMYKGASAIINLRIYLPAKVLKFIKYTAIALAIATLTALCLKLFL